MIKLREKTGKGVLKRIFVWEYHCKFSARHVGTLTKGAEMAENTPESDLGSIECFQNYTAPEVFIQGLAGIVDQQDVEAMIRAQKQM